MNIIGVNFISEHSLKPKCVYVPNQCQQ